MEKSLTCIYIIFNQNTYTNLIKSCSIILLFVRFYCSMNGGTILVIFGFSINNNRMSGTVSQTQHYVFDALMIAH